MGTTFKRNPNWPIEDWRKLDILECKHDDKFLVVFDKFTGKETFKAKVIGCDSGYLKKGYTYKDFLIENFKKCGSGK